MFSHYPSYFSNSPFESPYGQQPDPYRRQRLEAARREQAIRGARAEEEYRRRRALAQLYQRQQLEEQQRREAQRREAYICELRGRELAEQEHRRRFSQMYEPDDEAQEEEESDAFNPFFPFGFSTRRPFRRSRTASVAVPPSEAREQRQPSPPATPSPSKIPISEPSRQSPEPSKVPEVSKHQINQEQLSSTVSLIQSAWRQHASRKRALAEIDSIDSSFLSLQSSFQLPTEPEFTPVSSPSSSPSSGTTPKLAYTPTNRPILAFEDSATKLLTRLDAVDSAGDAGIRKARKALVIQIEEALRKLEDMKTEAWRRLCGANVEAKVEAPTEAVSESPAHADAVLEVEAATDALEGGVVSESEAIETEVEMEIESETTRSDRPVDQITVPVTEIDEAEPTKAEVSSVEPPVESSSSTTPITEQFVDIPSLSHSTSPQLLPPSFKHAEDSSIPTADVEDDEMVVVERTVTPTLNEADDGEEWFDASDEEVVREAELGSDIMDFL